MFLSRDCAILPCFGKAPINSMRNKVITVAIQTLRAAIRSRVVISLLALLVLVMVILPQTLHGDGTSAGTVRMVLTWTLGITTTLLAVASLWLGCSTLSSDIKEGAFTSVRVTAIRSHELWLGKWLGLSLLNLALQGIVLAVLVVQLWLQGFSIEELRPSQRSFPSMQGVPEHIAKMDYVPVNPQESMAWTFDWSPSRLPPDAEIAIHIGAVTSLGRIADSTGVVSVYDDARRIVFTAPAESSNGQYFQALVPAKDIPPHTKTLTVVYTNTAEEDEHALLMSVRDNVNLLVPGKSFFVNLCVAGIVLWAILATLTALGLTAGALFSLPVAVFVASAIGIISTLGGPEMMEPSHEHGDACDHASSSFSTDAISRVVSRAVDVLTTPINDAAPLSHLGDRICIPRLHALQSVLYMGLLMPMLFGLFGAFVLGRREYP